MPRVSRRKKEEASHRGVHYACLTCRIAFKKPSVDLLGKIDEACFPCPECQRPMQYMGRSFKAPRRNATRQWKKVSLLIQHGFRFETYANNALPKTLRDLEEFLKSEAADKNHNRRVL